MSNLSKRIDRIETEGGRREFVVYRQGEPIPPHGPNALVIMIRRLTPRVTKCAD